MQRSIVIRLESNCRWGGGGGGGNGEFLWGFLFQKYLEVTGIILQKIQSSSVLFRRDRTGLGLGFSGAVGSQWSGLSRIRLVRIEDRMGWLFIFYVAEILPANWVSISYHSIKKECARWDWMELNLLDFAGSDSIGLNWVSGNFFIFQSI